MISGMLIGVLAGLGTACLWAVSSIVNTAASRQLGVHSFLMIRQPVAVLVLGASCLAAGQFVLYGVQPLVLALLAGCVGIALSDWAYYKGAQCIGVRAAQICQSTNACMTAVLGVIFLDEFLGVQGYVGIGVVTLGSTFVLIAEQRGQQIFVSTGKSPVTGIALAFLSAFATAVGLIISKEALRYDVPPLMLAFLRNIAASAILWTFGVFLHRVKDTLHAARTCRSVYPLLALGCAVGPAGGMWLSMVALEYAPAAIAATLIGMQPLFLLLLTGILERRCPARGSIVGSVLACAGAAMVLLR